MQEHPYYQTQLSTLLQPQPLFYVDCKFFHSTTSIAEHTSYLDMLNDSNKNRAFHEAIDKTVTKNFRVLDIGYLLYTLHNPMCGLSH